MCTNSSKHQFQLQYVYQLLQAPVSTTPLSFLNIPQLIYTIPYTLYLITKTIKSLNQQFCYSSHLHIHKMGKSLSLPTLTLVLLALIISLANSARILNDDDTPQTPDSLPPLPSVDDSPSTLPSAHAPAAATDTPADQPQPELDDTPAPLAATSSEDGPAPASAAYTPVEQPDEPQPNPEDTPAPLATSVPNAAGTNTAAGGTEHPAISFYMHDVLGGSHASGRIVTGLIATENVNGIPFSRPNNQVFPVTNGVPLVNNNLNSLFNNNNNNVPGLNGQNQQQSQTVISNAGTNSGSVNGGGTNNQAFVTPGQLPSGVSLQQLMFGSVTVIDDELTEGPELGSGVIGKGQGFYLASSLDGESHTMAFTALFPGEHGHDEDDTVSFFGVHRTASPVSHLAIVGGTGKYENAKGYATIEALPQENQHTTDGVDTIAHISVYTY